MERRRIDIRGTVQGVGFRPFVYGLATRLGLRGFVRNGTGGVRIEVEGERGRLNDFLVEMANGPPLARVDGVTWEPCVAVGDRDFRIERSVSDPAGPVAISPDVATCADCLAELFDPRDRRYRYPFLNCTNCGPRLTIVTGAPYDRERTTMATFGMCAACRAEYEDPANRRFHAQPTACATCGPRLWAVGADGRAVDAADPLAWFAEALTAGKIGSMKGLGGYHLACDARGEVTVAELRRRKHRDEKPFAVMVRDLAAAEALCRTSPAERKLLSSPARPVVLLRKRATGAIAEAVAPGNPHLGVMLPYTPLHHLLLAGVGGRPLVMTSGNRSDEPIAFSEPDVFERLAGIADLFLTHDRPIHTRCDDSVVRVCDGREAPVRRSRGYAPRPLRLPLPCPAPILAVGGQLKGTFALGQECRAILSHHLGDLDHFEAYRAFEGDVSRYEQLFAIRPRFVAHDLHPDYATTRYALRRAADEGLTPVAVQHHHAHMASCMAEHGLTGPVIGVCFDGTGLGSDGNVWGGEFLVGDLRSFRRAVHLRYVGMPGGAAAIREPWRMALAHLADAEMDCPTMTSRIDPATAKVVRRMLERGVNTPLTSSAGRLFDAVASLAGVRDRVSFEGQAAMELEWLAGEARAETGYPFGITLAAPRSDSREPGPLEIDTRPLIRAVAEDALRGVAGPQVARRFHAALVDVIVRVCVALRRDSGIHSVVLSGGVFLNSLLARETSKELRNREFSVFRHRLVPPNDGGLSLGQLAIASRRLAVG